jgi:hypothetical protein
MSQYLFSYAYSVDGKWQFDALIFEARYCDENVLVQAQKNAAKRHAALEAAAVAVVKPIAVSKLDAPRMRITKK